MVIPWRGFVAMQQFEQHGLPMTRENPHFRVRSPIAAPMGKTTLRPDSQAVFHEPGKAFERPTHQAHYT
jgi:hypothetical protein